MMMGPLSILTLAFQLFPPVHVALETGKKGLGRNRLGPSSEGISRERARSLEFIRLKPE